MKLIHSEQVSSALNFEELIPALRRDFGRNFGMPQRHLYSLSEENHDSFALLPAWNDEVIANKLFTYFPDNKSPLKILYSKVLLFNRATGEPLAVVDGTTVTYWRTAAVSALASQLLSRHDSETLLLFGTGHLASYLIKAHLSVRPIKEVIIAGSSVEKSEQFIQQVKSAHPSIRFSACQVAEHDVARADIIVCATSAKKPLFDGRWFKDGTHIDCLGNHSKDHRECDTETVLRSSVYVDSRANVLAESGELIIPITDGDFEDESILGELSDICKTTDTIRQSDSENTLFVSVGTALSDLTAAYMAYQKY